MTGLVESSSLPEPIETIEDQLRLERPPSRARTISSDSCTSDTNGTSRRREEEGIEEVSPIVSSESEAEPDVNRMKGYESGHGSRTSGSEVEAGELEAEGELSDPPSPRSPPPPPLQEEEGEGFEFIMDDTDHNDDDATPNVSSVSTFSQTDLSASIGSNSSNLSSQSLPSPGFQRAPSPAVGAAHRRSSSSLSMRAGPLVSHRPPSSAGGSAGDRSISSLRHSRPIAPSRARRRQSEDPARAGSTEPTSPAMEAHAFAARSPTPSGRSRSSLGRSTSSGNVSLSSSFDSHRSGLNHLSSSTSQGEISSVFGSPGIDETSFHPAPLSPVGDVGPSSSSFASAFPSLSPPPPSPPAFDLNNGNSDPFAASSYPPESQYRRQSLSARSDGSRPSSLFEGQLLAGGHSRDGSSMSTEHVQQLIRHGAEYVFLSQSRTQASER